MAGRNGRRRAGTSGVRRSEINSGGGVMVTIENLLIELEKRDVEIQRLKETSGCLYTGSGRGDCEHFIGLPGKSIPGQHDGGDDTVDVYGKPNGWCWSCWKSYKRDQFASEPRLGCATTAELIDEIRDRCEVDGTLNYKTVGE